MRELIVNSFILLVVVIDPIGLAPLFASLTRDYPREEARRMAFKGIAIATVILVCFAFAGDALLRYLGISMPAFGIAGGILLFLLAVEMVLARRSGLRAPSRREQAQADIRHDISVFPLAIPMIAGPGALTTILLLIGDRGVTLQTLVVLLVLLVVLALTLLMLLVAAQVTHRLGESGASVITRVLGIVLAALAVQYVIDGIRSSFFT